MAKNLLIIGNIWPEPNSTAAGSRMLQLITLFQENNYQVTFVSTALKTEKSFDLEVLDIQTHEIQLNNSSFNSLAKEINPEIVLFDRFLTEEQFGWRITENCPNALKTLDTEDLHFLRHARHQAHKDKASVDLSYLTNDTTKREIASMYRCDISLIISKYEYNLLTETFKIDSSLLLYLPFLLNRINNSKIESYPDFKNRKHFMTIGNLKHKPNQEAVIHLKNKIWPLIRSKLPNTEMHIYGAYAPERIKQLHNKKEGFIIKGWIENKETAFKNAKVCLAPLQFGAGLKGKLINAMQYGTPSVTTSIGAEAMHDDLPWNGFIANKYEKFAEKAIELYTNEHYWLNAQQNGRAIINQCYSKENFGKIFINTLSQIQSNLKAHRLHNFIGNMLQHHTLQSTKYLSKWIEEKNSKN